MEELKVETRRKLIENIASRYGALGKLKDRHESEMEPLTREIDILQTSLEDAMKKRLKMIPRQVNEVKNLEDEIQITKRQLDSVDRLCGMGGPGSPIIPPKNIFEKDFECPVCYDVMAPPSRIFQCNNGHLICEDCKCHSEVDSNTFITYFLICSRSAPAQKKPAGCPWVPTVFSEISPWKSWHKHILKDVPRDLTPSGLSLPCHLICLLGLIEVTIQASKI